MKRVIVTGGAGFVGSHVVDALLRQGCTVMSYDCLLPQVHPASPEWPAYQPVQEGLSLHFGDVRDPRAMAFALADFRPDTVIHLAAHVGVGQSQHEVARYTSGNVTGTANLLQCVLEYNLGVRERAARVAEVEAKQATPEPGQTQEEAQALYLQRIAPMLEDLRAQPSAPIGQVLVAGSMSSYGEGAYRLLDAGLAEREGSLPADWRNGDEEVVRPTAGPWGPCPGHWDAPGMEPMATPEWWPLEPESVYAWTKAQQEALALLVWDTRGRAEGLAIKVARFFNAYGPRQALTNPYTGVGAIFSARVKAGLAPVVFEDGGQLRDFTHVTDVASAVLAILDHGTAGCTYNVGTGIPTSILQVARAICAGEVDDDGKPIEPRVVQVARVGDIRHCYGNVNQLWALGWEPKVQLEDGLVELRQWVHDQPVDLTTDLLERANADLERYGLVRQ